MLQVLIPSPQDRSTPTQKKLGVTLLAAASKHAAPASQLTLHSLDPSQLTAQVAPGTQSIGPQRPLPPQRTSQRASAPHWI